MSISCAEFFSQYSNYRFVSRRLLYVTCVHLVHHLPGHVCIHPQPHIHPTSTSATLLTIPTPQNTGWQWHCCVFESKGECCWYGTMLCCSPKQEWDSSDERLSCCQRAGVPSKLERRPPGWLYWNEDCHRRSWRRRGDPATVTTMWALLLQPCPHSHHACQSVTAQGQLGYDQPHSM